MKVFFLVNVAPGRVCCPTQRIATLSTSTRIIDARVSHACSTQQQVLNGGCLRRTCRQGVVIECLTAEGSRPIEVLDV